MKTQAGEICSYTSKVMMMKNENTQMQALRVHVDLDNSSLPKLVNILKPTVFEEDHLYCCVYGNDCRTAISGFGHTPYEAIEDWEASLKMRMRVKAENDSLIQEIFAKLAGKSDYKQAS